MTPSGIEPAIFRFVAQYLNHCATISGPQLKARHIVFRVYVCACVRHDLSITNEPCCIKCVLHAHNSAVYLLLSSVAMTCVTRKLNVSGRNCVV
jgi:hypothetical protein